MAVKTVSVLLVEDDEIDQMLIQRAFAASNIENPLHMAQDGVTALEILRGENGHVKPLDPFLILLDLNMPRMGGLEFMREMRNDPELRRNIVFVLTTSNSEKDRWQAYDASVSGYIVKSEVGSGFLNLTNLLTAYTRVVEFP